MSKSFLGVGWRFPVLPGSESQIAMAHYEDSIRQSIWIILGTAKGERVMRPDFGCGIHHLVFAVNSAGTAGRVISAVREALILWEPRIDLLNVNASSQGAQGNMLLIEIEYRVRATNNTFNLVYPFYLE
jgi:phage baseplate assembly protein W